MKLQDPLIEKTEDILLKMGLNNDIVDKFGDYIVGDMDEEIFLKSLPIMDMKDLDKDLVEEIASTYRSLEQHNAEEPLGRYLRMIFKIGEQSAIRVMERLTPDYYNRVEKLEKMLSYKVKPAYVIAYYASVIVCSENYLELNYIIFFDSIYEKYRDGFEEAFAISKTNQRMIIATYLIQKEGIKQSELCKLVEADIIDSIKVLFNNSIADFDINIVADYLKGNTSNIEEIAEVLIARKILTMNKYSLKLLLLINVLIINESEVATRFIKFAVLFDYKKTFDLLHRIIEIHYNVKKLVNDFQIDKKLYIVWMGSKTNAQGSWYKEELEEELTLNTEIFTNAVSMCEGFSKVYMASFLWRQGTGLEFVAEAEQIYIEEFSKFMISVNIDKVAYEKLIDYLKDEISFENIKKTLEGLSRNKQLDVYYHNYCKILLWLKDVSTMFERGMKCFISIGTVDMLRKLFDEYKEKDKNTLDSFIKLLESYGASINTYLPLLGRYLVYNEITAQEAKYIIATIISKDEDKFIECIAICGADIRVYFLDEIFRYNKQKNAQVLINYLGDSSKVVREKVIELLVDYEECHENILSSLSSKKQVVRESAVIVLSKNKTKKIVEPLKSKLEIEKNEKIKLLLREVLEFASDLGENNEELDILDYCKKALKGNKAKALKWIDFDSLPKVKFKDTDKFAEDEVLKYLLICYASNGQVALRSEGKKVGELLNKQDLAEFSIQVFEKWMDNDADTKKKWVLIFVAIHGDYRVIYMLKKNIETWSENLRGAVASEAVKALALSGSDEALVIVDNLSRKFKFKQVKNAAALALEFAAKELGIEMEELSDKIVPNLGFDIKGERIFDYGDRKFIAILTPELTVEVYDESNKKLKNLPAPNKKDDEVKASIASLEFKALKKQLKTIFSIQTTRLEMALSSNRKWNKEAWVKLFVQNPIMHQFAIGLIWGVYKDNNLVDTFRYMEDGTFNTKDEDEYKIESTAIIGILHPVELTSDDMAIWKEQLENYEINQPFEQLHRQVFQVIEEEKVLKRVDRFGGIILNALSLLGKLTGFQWYRGSIVDGGGYYTFYKEDKAINLGVELAFSGSSVGYEEQEVTVYGITFYKAGTVERGNYTYDKVKDDNIIAPSEVPKRFFSEILYQINKATASKTGTNENWRNEE